MAKRRRTELDLDTIKEEPPPATDNKTPEKTIKKVDTLKPRFSKKLLIIVGSFSLIVLIGMGVSFFFLVNKPQDNVKKEEKIDVFDPPTINTEPLKSLYLFLIPIEDKVSGKERFLKMGISLVLSDIELEKEIEKNISMLRDRILLMTQKIPLTRFKSAGGRRKIRNEMKNIINMSLQTGSIKKIYFTELVVL